MSGNEFLEWMAYERLEPFGPMAADFRAGEICATVANVQRRKECEPFKASDFMPSLRSAIDRNKPPQKDMSNEEHAALMDAELFGLVKGV